MRNVSSGFADELNNDNRSYLCYADMTLQDGTTLNFDNTNLWSGSFSFEDAVSSDNTFDIGSVIIGVLKFTINNIDDSYSEYDFNGAKVTAYAGMELADGTTEKLRIGYYTVYETPKYNGATISLECYDNLYMLDSDASDSTLEYPATLMQIVQDTCTNCGITLGTTSFENSNYIVDEKPVENGLTYRKLMAWVAQILCKWVRVNNSGQLVLEWYDMNTYEKLPETGSGAYTHIRYAMDAQGTGMTDKPSLWDASGRNLYLGTKDFSGTSWANSGMWTTDGTYNGFTVKKRMGTWEGLGQHIAVSLGEEYTFSGYVKNSVIGNVALFGNSTSDVNAGNINNGGIKITHTEEWTKLSVTFKVTVGGEIRPRFENSIEGGTLFVCGLKLEKGTTATPWTPAPEDYPEDYVQPYIGIANTDSPVAPTDPSLYTWSTYNGEPVNLDAVHTIDSIASKQIYTDDVVITGIQVIEQLNTTDADNTETYLSGNEGYILSIEKNLLIQNGKGNTVASLIGERLIGLRFRPYSLTCLGDIRIEAGDLVRIVDEKGRVYKSLITSNHFGIGEYEKIACGAQSPERNSASRYSAETVAYVRLRQLIKKEQTAREQAIENLANQLSDSSGMFITVEPQPDGSSIYYMHNKPKLTDSNIVWKLTAEAFGISTDGGVTYPYGFAVTGEMITRLLYAEGIDADYINTGAIMIRDTNGNIIFSVNMDTGQVIISGDSVRIGDKSVEQAINDVSDEASQARTLQVSLSNDYQAVSTDADGNYTGALNISTIVSVYYGHTNVSEECSYSYIASDGVTGAWAPTIRRYTVTGLSSDEGWVDIIVTYLSTFTVTKRFSISKVKNGAEGQPGAAYTVETSASVIKQSKNDALIPSYLDYTAYTRIGYGARTPYAGRFKIEESTNGITWSTIYTSTVDESSVRYSAYTFLTDENGDVITDASGNGLALLRDVALVRCTFYASGGTTQLLDRQVTAVVKDADSLSSEDAFNLLTNNGLLKGIYKEGEQLYVNATYIKTGILSADLIKTGTLSANYINGGTLTLGGENNTNGKIIMLDKDGKQVGLWDNGTLYTTSADIRGGHINIRTDSSEGSSVISLSAAYGGMESVIDMNPDPLTGIHMGVTYPEHIFLEGNAYFNTQEISLIGGEYYNHSCVVLNPGKMYIADRFQSTDLDSRYCSIDMNNGCGRIHFRGDSFVFADLGESQSSGFDCGAGTFHVYGNIYVTGTKNRIIATKNYADRLQYCYEMASPMFGDIGESVTDETGECYIFIDDIFQETVNSDCKYYVFLQKEGEGDLWVSEKTPAYFIVKGTPDLKFSWELKARQQGYENERLEQFEKAEESDDSAEIDYEREAITMVRQYYKELEDMFNEEIN